MKSTAAHGLAKAERRDLKQRAKARDKNADGAPLSTLGTFTLRQQNTDYPVTPDLAKLPMAVRERSRVTEWPVGMRVEHVIHQPESRNYGGTIWRRWPDGRLALAESLAALEAAIMKFNRELVPLNESEALMLAAIFPEIHTSNMPKHAVEIKARGSPKEKDALRDGLRIWPTESTKPEGK